jgi:hypothetical protein
VLQAGHCRRVTVNSFAQTGHRPITLGSATLNLLTIPEPATTGSEQRDYTR